MAQAIDGLFDDEPPVAKAIDGLFDDEPKAAGLAAPTKRFSDEQMAAEAERQKTGKRKQFDAEPVIPDDAPPDARFANPDSEAFLKDFAAPFYDPDARRQIKDPALGLPAEIAAAAESIPVKITSLGTTPVMEAPAPNRGIAPQVSEAVGGAFARTLLTAPAGIATLGTGEALAKTAEIGTTDPTAFRERPAGTATRIGLAGAIPGVSAKLAGVVAPMVTKSANQAANVAAGVVAGGTTDFALNEVQKGGEYLLTGNEPKTAAGLAHALKPTAMDIATLAPGAIGGGFQAARGAAGLARKRLFNEQVDPQRIDAAEREIISQMSDAELYPRPLLEYGKTNPETLPPHQRLEHYERQGDAEFQVAVDAELAGNKQAAADAFNRYRKTRFLADRASDQVAAAESDVANQIRPGAAMESLPPYRALESSQRMYDPQLASRRAAEEMATESYAAAESGEPRMAAAYASMSQGQAPFGYEAGPSGQVVSRQVPPPPADRSFYPEPMPETTPPKFVPQKRVVANQPNRTAQAKAETVEGMYSGPQSPGYDPRVQVVRDAGAKTVAEIKALFPPGQLDNRLARSLRDAAWLNQDAPSGYGQMRVVPGGAVRTPEYNREFGATNRLFTKSAYEAAKQRLAAKPIGTIPTRGSRSRGSMNLDPDRLRDLITMGGYYVEGGMRDFGKWSGQMVRDFGESIRPHLQSIWSQIHSERQVIPPDGLRTREGQGQARGTVEPPAEPFTPTRLEGQGDPSKRSEALPTVAQGATDDPRYAGGFNKRLFGMEDNPELQAQYEATAERLGPGEPLGRTRAAVREAADKAQSFDVARMRKIKSYDDAASLSDVDRQVLSDQADYFQRKRLEGTLSKEDSELADESFRAAKVARGEAGSRLALLNQEPAARYVQNGDYKMAALKVLDDMDPSGKASDDVVKAIREMGDTPLDMARTVFRQSRKHHGFLQNFITANLLSNVLGTAPLNMASNIMNVAAQTARRAPSEWGTAMRGLDRGYEAAKGRAAFAATEGFTMEALQNPKLAATAPGFAAGGLKNPFNWGGRAAFSGDEFIKGMAEQSHLDVLAKANALERAAGDAAKAARIEAALRNDPTPEMLKEAKEFAKNVSYQMEPDEASGALSRFINWAPIGKGTRAEIKPIKIAVPFFNTVMNVAKANAALSPIGAVGAAYKGARGKITPGQAVTQVAMGLIPTAIGVGLAQNGLITGPIPKDPGEREAFFGARNKPWTIKAGDYRIPLAWAGPFALSLGLGAALKDAEGKADRGKIDDTLASIGAETAGNAFRLFMEGSPLVTLSSLLDAIADPNENKLKKLATNVGSSMTPLVALQGFLNRQNIPGLAAIRDPYLRDKSGQTALEDVLNGIVDRTLASRTLPKRKSSFWRDIERPGQMTQAPPDPVYSELYRMGIFPSMPGQSLKLPGAAKPFKLTPEEYRTVLESGSPAFDRLSTFVQSPEYMQMPEEQRRRTVDAYVEKLLPKARAAGQAKVKRARISGVSRRF